MIIIAGAGHPKTEKHISLKSEYCGRCNNNAPWLLEKTRYFISVFFIPTISYKTEYKYSCSICGNSRILDKQAFERKLDYETRPYQ